MTDHHHHHHHAQCAARIALPTRVATSTSSTTTTLTTSTSSTTAAKAAAAADMHNNDPTTTKDDEDDVRQSADDDQHRHHQRRKYQHQTSEASAPSVGPTCGFYKFLAWFSGRRRPCLHRRYRALVPYVTIFLIFSLLRNTDACSSRTIPKPRPPTPTPRPNITFHTYKCPPAYAAWYCLNDATCFTVKIGDSLLYNCECAEGYMGPRCEYKDLDGSYLPSRPRVMLETASIASGATLALVMVLILCVFFYVKWHQQQKQERLELEQDANANDANGVDTVDGLHTVRCGPPEMRPFGPHHQRTIPMAEALQKR